jgi:polysaccharide pyruvyl transferase WcaK-like protein
MEYLIYSEDLNNYGDLSLVVQAVSTVKSKDPGSDVKVLSWNAVPDFASKELQNYNVKIVSDRWLYLFQSLRAKGFALWPGGQLIRNNSSNKYLILMVLLTACFRINGVSMIVMGAGASNIGKFKAFIYRMIFRNTDRFYVRDSETKYLLENKGFFSDIEVSADLMFSRLGAANYTLRSAEYSPSKEKACMTIAPCYSEDEGRLFDVDQLVRNVVEFCASNPDYVVRVVAHDVRPGMDDIIMQKISMLLAEKSIYVELLFPRSLNELINIYRESELVITNRLHAIIFSCLSECKFSIIEDGNVKITSLLRQMGLKNEPMNCREYYFVSSGVLNDIDEVSSRSFSWLFSAHS